MQRFFCCCLFTGLDRWQLAEDYRPSTRADSNGVKILPGVQNATRQKMKRPSVGVLSVCALEITFFYLRRLKTLMNSTQSIRSPLSRVKRLPHSIIQSFESEVKVNDERRVGGLPAAKGAMLPGEGLNTIVLPKWLDACRTVSTSVTPEKLDPCCTFWSSPVIFCLILWAAPSLGDEVKQKRNKEKRCRFYEFKIMVWRFVFVDLWVAAGRVWPPAADTVRPADLV